eukprot:221328-Chlamydomonas_euryale.AAC.1
MQTQPPEHDTRERTTNTRRVTTKQRAPDPKTRDEAGGRHVPPNACKRPQRHPSARWTWTTQHHRAR